MDKLDVYRISDPMFRVHARLFRVQEAILRSSRQQIRAAKRTVIAQAAGNSALFAFLLTLMVGIFKIEWNSAPVIVIVLVAVAAVLIHVQDVISLKKDEVEFDRLLGEEGGEDVESWVDYAESLVAAYGTRLKMITDAMDEAATLHSVGELDDNRFRQRTTYLADIRAYCLQELEEIRADNEALYGQKKRALRDYESVKRFLDIANPVQAPEPP